MLKIKLDLIYFQNTLHYTTTSVLHLDVLRFDKENDNDTKSNLRKFKISFETLTSSLMTFGKIHPKSNSNEVEEEKVNKEPRQCLLLFHSNLVFFESQRV
ncbi:CLUMA_CG008094, isoform A [Clunio marinus]|uniref:CLUMA_CG008094, isoform A n=1 Tax=Clunio marinus TaxID=568069 RepID=A0A1J1I4B1_9DIPT|nr:CLUMA_CG008094, isoform A [Clunio marinus]